jgi:hypothetical protein
MKYRVKWDSETLGGFTTPAMSLTKAKEKAERVRMFVEKGGISTVSNVRVVPDIPIPREK